MDSEDSEDSGLSGLAGQPEALSDAGLMVLGHRAGATPMERAE